MKTGCHMRRRYNAHQKYVVVQKQVSKKVVGKETNTRIADCITKMLEETMSK